MRRLLIPFVAFALLWLLQAMPLAAEESVAPSTTVPEISTESLQAGRARVESSQDLSEAQRKPLLDLFDEALQRLNDLAGVREQAASLERTLANAPERLDELQRLGRNVVEEIAGRFELPDDAPLEDIDRLIRIEEAALEEARASLRRHEDELTRLLGGAGQLNELISARNNAIAQLERELASTASGESELAVQARQLNLETRRQLRIFERDFHRAVLANQATLTRLLQAERDYWNLLIAEHGPRLDELKAIAQQRRETRAQAALEEAEALRVRSSGLPPELQQIAEANARWREELETLVRREQGVNAQLQRTARDLEQIGGDFERIRQRVELVGRSKAIGDTLRKRRAELPSLRTHRRDTQLRGESMSLATNRQLELDDVFRDSGALEQRINTAIQQWGEPLPEEARAALQENARDLMAAHRDTLSELQQTYGRYINSLTSLDVAERQLVTVAENYIVFIDEQLLWIPSTGLISLFSGAAMTTEPWLAHTANWRRFASSLSEQTGQRPISTLLFIAALTGLLLFNRGTRERLKRIDALLNKVRTDSAMLSVAALGLLVLRIAPLPLVLLALAELLRNTPDPFVLSVTVGLTKAAWLIASLGLLRVICKDQSLGDHHLGWPGPLRKALRKHLGWFIPFGALTSFMVGAMAGPEPPLAVQAVGSAAFILLMTGTIILVQRLLGEKGPVRETLKTEYSGKLITHLLFLWYPIVLGIPAALALLSLSDYHYTAVHLEEHVQKTVWFLLAVFILKELILRWLFVTERRLRFNDALRRRDELRAQRAAKGEDAQDDTTSPITVEVPEINFDSLGEQSKRLVRAGFLFTVVFGTWSIWASLIPALGFFDATELPFQAMRSIDGVSTLVPVTLGDIMVGLFIIVVTVLAAKNLPGILEISLLQRLPLDAGARYAITALSQYLIAGIGLIIAFKTIGLQWSGLQWLIAALGVGLGFGLQEIVANFVSGIILLFERPIRVGDVVTIDGTTGVVTRIRIRATTITNYEKQELIVPNKEFITNRLINWTLTDKLNRILIPVGLAYGGDVDKAMALMREAAVEHPEILEDPAPVVSFEEFADNGMMLYLRAYLANLDNRLAVITDLHRAINSKFNAAELCIAFPQRDIHLDTTRPLEIRLQRSRASEAPAE